MKNLSAYLDGGASEDDATLDTDCSERRKRERV